MTRGALTLLVRHPSSSRPNATKREAMRLGGEAGRRDDLPRKLHLQNGAERWNEASRARGTAQASRKRRLVPMREMAPGRDMARPPRRDIAEVGAWRCRGGRWSCYRGLLDNARRHLRDGAYAAAAIGAAWLVASYVVD